MNSLSGTILKRLTRTQMFRQVIKSPTTSRIHFRSIHNQLYNTKTKKIKFQLSFRPFSTRSDDDDDLSSSKDVASLASLIERELKTEMDAGLNEMPQNLADLKSTISQKWTIVDESSSSTISSSSGAVTRMFRKEPLANGGKIALTFHCQDTLEDTLEDTGSIFESITGGDEKEKTDEEEDEESSPIRFDLTVTRAGKTLCLSCISENAAASVESVTVLTGENNNSKDVEEDSFRGPDLEELPEDVLDAMEIFVSEDCGVDEDVAAFLAMYADYKEQLEYVEWLDGLSKVIA